MGDWAAGEVRPVRLEDLGEGFRRYRLPDTASEGVMRRSLERYGQMAPVVVWLRQETPEVIDGFKRVVAARQLRWPSLSARPLAADERTAKAAIYGLNRLGRPTREWEEAWLVQALVREDRLTQVEVAELLGRHKSWVCRRLALVEKLAAEAKDELRLGLLPVTLARALVRLPVGNQAALLTVVRRDGLSNAEVNGVIDVLRGTVGQEQQSYVLAHPREALRQARAVARPGVDPRLSKMGNGVGRQLGGLLNGLAHMEHWLRHRGRADLTANDQRLLQPSWQKLTHDARSVAELAADLMGDEVQP
jgi:ParB-like chromosome segregation protein Spo0J